MLSKLGIQLKKSAVVEVDYLELCTEKIRVVEDFANRGNLLNQRQCEDLSSKLLLKIIPNIRKLVSRRGASPDIFRLALEKLYRHVEKAKALVSNCGKEDWPTAAVFQIQNENAFRQILFDIGLCYNVIYEQAKSSSASSNGFPEDLRLPSLFSPAKEIETQQDQQDLERMLEDFANEPSSSNVPAIRTLKQCLASYLLLKLKHSSEQSEATALDIGSAILWAKDREPRGTWGMKSSFLGAGSGGSGVCKTKWMDLRCAKKGFHATENEAEFLKEAGILAHLNHPCIVKLFCCGNEKMGKRFIAMELMEKSLLKLIEEQKNVCFPFPIAVDLMVQMARGLCYLHGQGIAHRDLKPLNVVVSTLTNPHVEDHFCVKLVDFGMSKTKVQASKLKTMSGFGIGTTRYKAPEVYRKAHLDGEGRTSWFKADVFSFAITCAHVLSLKVPFGDIGAGSLYRELVNGTRPELPAYCPQELVGLLQGCWDIDPTSRPPFVEICTRLETLQYKLLRGFSSLDDDLESMDFDGGFRFIEAKVKEQYSVRKLLGDGSSDEFDEVELTILDEVEEESVDADVIERRNVVSVFSCPCGRSLEFLPRVPYESGGFECNICGIFSDEEVYHCANCQFDAHKDCAEIKDDVEVFFHADPLHLLVEYYYDNNSHVACDFCGESLQGSKWVYNCKECDFNVHALCTKHAQKVNNEKHHFHPLTLVQSHQQASCNSCNGDFKGYRYTCTRKACSIDLHPSCIILSPNPLCIFDSSHRLSLNEHQKGFHCGKCGGVGSSWYYKCSTCFVEIHVDCVNDMEAVELVDWNEAYEQLMLKYENKADHAKMAPTITELLDMLLMSTGLETSSFLASRPKPVQALVSSLESSEASSSNAFDDVHLERKICTEREREERKAKRMAVMEARVKARAELVSGQGGKLEKLERLLQEHMQISELDARALIEAQEKLRKLQDFVYGVRNSKMRQVPRIALRSSYFSADRVLLSPLDAREKSIFYLLCEEPGYEHVLKPWCEFRLGMQSEAEVVEKMKPFLVAGFYAVQNALNKATNITDSECVTLPILGKNQWDLRAIKDLEKPDVQTNLGNEDMDDVELHSETEDTAAQWLRNYFEGISIFEMFGLLRVRYTSTEQGDYPRFKQGSAAWLCAKHHNQGVEARVLVQCPLRTYHNLKYDIEHGFASEYAFT